MSIFSFYKKKKEAKKVHDSKQTVRFIAGCLRKKKKKSFFIIDS